MNNMIETERLLLELSTDEEMERILCNEQDEGMKQAYAEMIAGAKAHPDQREWNAVWLIKLKNRPDQCIGDMCFKGLSSDGMVEIGYGMKPEYEGKGYMTEAVKGIVRWASSKPEITRIEAEADPDNHASHRVLEKAGFIRNGIMGNEGPRFIYAG